MPGSGERGRGIIGDRVVDGRPAATSRCARGEEGGVCPLLQQVTSDVTRHRDGAVMLRCRPRPAGDQGPPPYLCLPPVPPGPVPRPYPRHRPCVTPCRVSIIAPNGFTLTPPGPVRRRETLEGERDAAVVTWLAGARTGVDQTARQAAVSHAPTL